MRACSKCEVSRRKTASRLRPKEMHTAEKQQTRRGGMSRMMEGHQHPAKCLLQPRSGRISSHPVTHILGCSSKSPDDEVDGWLVGVEGGVEGGGAMAEGDDATCAHVEPRLLWVGGLSSLMMVWWRLLPMVLADGGEGAFLGGSSGMMWRCLLEDGEAEEEGEKG